LKKGESLTNTDKEIIKEVMPFITVYLLSNTKKAVLYHKSLEEFFFSIIEGNYNEDELKLKEESSYRNIDFSKSRYVWTIESTITDENEYLRLEKKLVSIFQMYDNIFCHKRYSKNIMFIIENQKLQSNTKLLDSFYEKLVLDLKKSFRDQEFTIGISKICNSLKYLYFAGEEANFALKIGKKLNKNPGGVYLYDDYMIYHLLYEISGHPTLSKLYKNTIKRIKKHDSENNSELLKTLETLIDCDFSVSHTSDRLFIHRNTLYKRINKINDILDSDIDKSENRLILQIAMKLNEIISE
jgi:sugar diacid utilization regulator